MNISEKQLGEMMGKITELTGAAQAWKAKAEQQESEIVYLRMCLERERSRNTFVPGTE